MARGRSFVVTVALSVLYACGGAEALPDALPLGLDGGGRDVRIVFVDAGGAEDALVNRDQPAKAGEDAATGASDLTPAIDAASASPDLMPAIDTASASPDLTPAIDTVSASPDLAPPVDAGVDSPTKAPRCGDGQLDAPHEVCDDGANDTCGACNADCSGPGTGPGSCPPVTAAECAISGPVPKISLKNNTLRLLFDDAHNKIRLTTSSDGFLQLVDFSAGDIDPYKVVGDLVLVNGQPVDTTTLDALEIIFCDGEDQLLEPMFSVPELRIFGGAGDDVIKIPLGRGIAYVYLGPGDDSVNAEHHETNWLYGEDGNDRVAGSSDGANFLYGGSGRNSMITFEHFLPASLYHTTRDTTVYRQGASETWMDMRADNDYVFVSDGSGAAGRVTISDHGGDDVLDFSRWEHPVTVDPQLIGQSQVVSRAPDGTPLLELNIIKGSFERVILP